MRGSHALATWVPPVVGVLAPLTLLAGLLTLMPASASAASERAGASEAGAVAGSRDGGRLPRSIRAAFARARSRPEGKLVPLAGTLLGSYVDEDGRWTGNEDHMAEVERFEAELGRRLHINHHYYALTDRFPSGLEEWDLANDRIPLVTWEAWGTTLQRIVDGEHDALIRRRAREVAALGGPVFLRWGHEMNGNWYPWSGVRNNDEGEITGPARFVTAWRRLHDLFSEEGADNAVWVWSPNADPSPAEAWNHWRAYYPGHDYVDWVGIDGYNWGATRSWSSWRRFRDIVQGIYDDYAERKPIMVAETSSAEPGGSKASWIAEARRDVKRRFPSIAAFVWFHVDKEADWRATSSPEAFEAFRAMAGDPRFHHLPWALSRLAR